MINPHSQRNQTSALKVKTRKYWTKKIPQTVLILIMKTFLIKTQLTKPTKNPPKSNLLKDLSVIYVIKSILGTLVSATIKDLSITTKLRRHKMFYFY